MYNKLANILVNYSLKIKPGDKVGIRGTTFAEPLLKEVFKEVLRAGGNPHMLVEIPGLSEYFVNNATDQQMTPNVFMKLAVEEFDAILTIMSEPNTKSLSRVPGDRMQALNMIMKPIRDTLFRREAEGSMRWCGTLFPTQAYAMDSEMSLDEFEKFYFGACHLYDDDPLKHWGDRKKAQESLVKWMTGKSKLRLVGDGTDLRMDISGRKWVNADGSCNFPDGEVFSGPQIKSVEGEVRFSYPAVMMGNEVNDVRLTFKNGKVVKEDAGKNVDFLRTMLNTDEGARYLGEIAIGTNHGVKEFTKNILLDEKIGGTVHMAVGCGIPETGNTNQSAIHWDMICDLRSGGKVIVDDVILMENGLFLPAELKSLNSF